MICGTKRITSKSSFVRSDVQWQCIRIPALPFCHLRLTAKRSDLRLPKELKIFGDHICKRRIELGLRQREVGDLLGVDSASVNAWERNCRQPVLRRYAAIRAFLGYDPENVPADAPLGLRIASRRRKMGLSQGALAGLLGIDEGTVRRWERGSPSRPGRRVREIILRWLGGDAS